MANLPRRLELRARVRNTRCAWVGAGVSGAPIEPFSSLTPADRSEKGEPEYDSILAGETTTVNGMFEVSGAAGNLLQIRSTVDGSEAFLALAAADMGDFVDVKDNHAIPSPVAVTGLLASGNNLGWTFAGVVPSMGVVALALLAGTLFWSGRRGLR